MAKKIAKLKKAMEKRLTVAKIELDEVIAEYNKARAKEEENGGRYDQANDAYDEWIEAQCNYDEIKWHNDWVLSIIK